MSVFTKSVLAFALLLFAAVAVAAQDKAPASAVGRWKFNVEKSDYGNAPKPKSATLNIMADSADSLKWHATVTDSTGKRETYDYSAPEDGQQHPVIGDNPWKTAAYTRGDSGVNGESVVTKDGKTQKADISMSADGNTMTVKGSDGGPTSVWERIKSSTARHKKTARE